MSIVKLEKKRLSKKDRKFVDLYRKYRNGKNAYLEAYDKKGKITNESAMVMASNKLRNINVQYEIDRLDAEDREELRRRLNLSKESLAQDLETIKRRSMQEEKIYNKQGQFKGEFRFDGSTAVRAVREQAEILGLKDSGSLLGLGDGNHSITVNLIASKEEKQETEIQQLI